MGVDNNKSPDDSQQPKSAKPIPEGFNLREVHRKNVDPDMQKKFNELTLRIKVKDPDGRSAPPPWKWKYRKALLRWHFYYRWKKKNKKDDNKPGW